MIERWLTAVRDHPERPAAMQCHVLTMLALRLNWTTGAGFAGTRDLMDDADASKSTVMRATSWARDRHFLLRTRRGHYINAQTAIASQWQLTQGVTGDTLAMTQGANGSDPRCQQDQPKVSVETTHQESSTSQPSKTARASAAQGQGQGQGRSDANSENHRVHDGSDSATSDDQQIPYRGTSPEPSALTVTREATP